MAQSTAYFSGASGTGAEYQYIYLDFWVDSQSQPNNTTTFGYRLGIASVSGGSGITYGGSYSLSGARSESASGLYWSWNANGLNITNGTFTVTHNASGELANQTLYASATYSTNSGNATASTSVTISVPQIPRNYYVQVGNGSSRPVRGEVYVGNSSNRPVKAKEVYVGNGSNKPVIAKY